MIVYLFLFLRYGTNCTGLVDYHKIIFREERSGTVPPLQQGSIRFRLYFLCRLYHRHCIRERLQKNKVFLQQALLYNPKVLMGALDYKELI